MYLQALYTVEGKISPVDEYEVYPTKKSSYPQRTPVSNSALELLEYCWYYRNTIFATRNKPLFIFNITGVLTNLHKIHFFQHKT